MKKLPLIAALALTVVPTAASAEPLLTHGNAALATFEHTSDDGCVHTVGELALVRSSAGAPVASGVYVTGSREDVCAGTGMGFATLVEGDFRMIGLYYAHYLGSFVAESYSGGEPVSFEVDLKFFGKGSITREQNVFEDGGNTTFTLTARRNAAPQGTLTADGVDMEITSATFSQETTLTR